MAHVYRSIVTALAILASCSSKQAPSSPSIGLPPNAQLFAVSSEKLWSALMETVQYEQLYPLEIQQKDKGYFSTKLISDPTTNPPQRFRLTGTLVAAPEGIVVTLYKQHEIFQDNRWRSAPSDSVLEKVILKRLEIRLGVRRQSP